ncbi:MAG: AAA family ATPase [Azonexaceae bacterium]|nr:AAA family ATPase [Azonexaceae bacterium]
MATYTDAVGYLNDLATEISESWFSMICDLTVVGGVSALDQLTLETLIAIYTDRASYIGVMPAAGPAAVAPVPEDFLDQLSGFSNFKRLGDALEVSFKKRVNLIFGTNGSGKSSLCESLKVLATTEPPNRPLQNVRAPGAGSPTFQYKFKSDPVHQAWTPAVGYGPKRTVVKYFDTAIAIRNVKDAVDPGRVIVLTPFRLHVFEWTKALTTKLREALQRQQQDNAAKLTLTLGEIRADFTKYKGRPLSVIDDKTVAVLPAQILLGEGFKDQKLLSEKQEAAAQLEKAASEEGLKLLRAEHRELETFLTSINTLLSSAASLWALEPPVKAKTLAKKQLEQEILAKALIPKNGTLEGLLALLRATAPLCKMDDAAGHACPLCKRDMGAPEVELFKRYHDLLIGELEKDIAALRRDIAKSVEFATTVSTLGGKGWEKYTTIQAEVLTAAKTVSDCIVANCDVSKEPTREAKAALESLKLLAAEWATQAESKKNAIDAAMKGREELIKQLTKLRGEIEPLEYAQAIAVQLNKLRGAAWRADRSKFWGIKLPAFTQTLTKITKKAKEAHEELVVADFEERLNAEYKALTEKDMAAFGVTLARKGADASVTVLPHIGGKGIEGVLSEGEQRVHALALFFAEIESCPQSVLIFDDPVSSFDYNYIANYCARLRDFAQQHQTRQIIVLTHNWEFFVQLQTTLNQAGLDSHLSVQVLENCSVVADYSEKLDDLKKGIEDVLNTPGEPSRSQKEEIAGKMRRLIEVVVNTHVFNQQRHQYKQKSQAISAFQSFTKIVPLLPAEATTLRDLYAKLSITEHDDPRNAYVNSDKAMFQTRYSQIQNIETAIAARKP